MSGFYVTNYDKFDINETNKYLFRRGQDYRIIDHIDNFSFIYNIFLLYGENEIVFRNEYYAVFLDGIIFNSNDKSFSGLSKFLIDMYEEYGVYFTKKLDGEFSICFLDFNKKKIIFSKDVFGTKPLWYSNCNGVAISSYKSGLIANGKDYIRAQKNTTYVMDFSGNILQSFPILELDINQHKQSYEDWCNALDAAVKKRIITNEYVGIGLSSGYDSGVIFCALKKFTNNFLSMSFMGKETEDILKKRILLHQNAELLQYEENEFLVSLKELYKWCEPYSEEYFELLKDEASVGLGIICKRLKKENIKIYFSGIEFSMSPFMEASVGGKKNSSIDIKLIEQFPSNLQNLDPWKYNDSFVYAERDEYVCGCYGIQATYPLFDPALVQEFLWLSAELKNQAYKAPIDFYFTKHKFPFSVEKAGFFVRDI